MGAITAFTYTLLKERVIDASSSEKQKKIRLQCGDGSLTYPTGGIPVSQALLGLPNSLESLVISDSYAPDGYFYRYNKTSGKIMIFQPKISTGSVATHTHSIPSGTDAGGGTSGTTAPAFTGGAASAMTEILSTATPTIDINIVAEGF